MKLVSMVDFVLQRDRSNLKYIASLQEIKKYAQFLKQPLKLEMFVPCDDKCNVLTMWTESNGYVILYNNNSDRLNKIQKISQGDVKGFIKYEGSKYQKAQEKVLFNHIYEHYCYTEIEEIEGLIEQGKTIESLVKFNLELTQNAIKQF